MRRLFCWIICGLIGLLIAPALLLSAQQPEAFHWVDFHAQQDQDVVVWVTRSLGPEKWSAIREIGVEYDAALVITTLKPTPQSLPDAETFTVWSLSLTNHSLTPLLKGVNLRLLDWMLLAEGKDRELAALYDNCTECAPESYFTAFHYDAAQHGWAARWMRGEQAVPVWSTKAPEGVDVTQVYSALSDPNGRALLAVWNHFDYGKQKDAEDFVYRYDLDFFSGLERSQQLGAKDADSMKLRLCSAQGAVPGLARGQEAPLCQQLVHPHPERKPVTTPPANNHGRSLPPGAKH